MILKGKKGVVMGVANDRSMAVAIAKEIYHQGGRMAFSHLPDSDDRSRMAKRAVAAVNDLEPLVILPCDVSNKESVELFFQEIQTKLGKIDFVVHSVAFAPLEDIRCPTIEASKDGFLRSMEVSVYSLIEVVRSALPHLAEGCGICTLTYYGGEKVMPGYNMMGICKAALDATVKYLAYDLGKKNIRVNGISAGPMRTLASSAIGDFKQTLEFYRQHAPINRNITATDLGNAASFLVSDLAAATTGEIFHVDCGYNIMGASPR